MSLTVPAPSDSAPRWWQRFGLYSDGWSRLLDWTVRRCPFFFEHVLLPPYGLIFFLAAGAQRRAVMANLAVIRPQDSAAGRWFRAVAVFWEFAWMMVDSARARQGERHLSWRLVEEAPFRDLVDAGGAAIILTAHMGNYDVAGPFFARMLGRKLHGVRVAERRAELQSYWESQRRAQESADFQIRYNQPGSFLGIELAQILAAGELVAIQGDRVVSSVSPLEVVWHGHAWPLPAGPFALALATGAPVFPIFVLRDGWRRYRIVVRPPHPAPEVPVSRSGRQEAQARLVSWWASELAGMVERNWAQWLVFEPAFGPAVRSGDEAGRPVITAVAPSVPPAAIPSPDLSPPTGEPTVRVTRSVTALGRWIDRLTGRDARENPLVLRALDAAQNPAETAVLATLSAAVSAAAAFSVARMAGVGPAPAAGLAVPGAFILMQVAMGLCGGLADLVRRVVGRDRARWTVPRLTEAFVLMGLTLVSVGLLHTAVAPIGAIWLGLVSCNGVVFLASALADWRRR